MGISSVIFVFLGGGIGSVLRFTLSRLIVFGSNNFPWATLLSNTLASLILALIVFEFKDTEKWTTFYLLFVVGICGGFSTFSTFSYENYQLLQQGNFIFLIFNILISIVFGIFIFWILARV